MPASRWHPPNFDPVGHVAGPTFIVCVGGILIRAAVTKTFRTRKPARVQKTGFLDYPVAPRAGSKCLACLQIRMRSPQEQVDRRDQGMQAAEKLNLRYPVQVYGRSSEVS